MTGLYILMAVLTAGVCIKLILVLSPRTGGRGGAWRADRFLAGGIVFVLPLAVLAIYLSLGRPDMKGQQALFDMTDGLIMRQAALLAERPMEILARRNPDDIGAHLSLSLINQRIGRYDEEAKFLARAVELAAAAGDPYLRFYADSLGQAQVRANGGVVGDDAIETFEYARSLYADAPVARHFLALAIAQRGDPEQALDLWRVLLAEGPSRAYWKDMVRKAMEDARRNLQNPPAEKPSEEKPAAEQPDTDTAPQQGGQD